MKKQSKLEMELWDPPTAMMFRIVMELMQVGKRELFA